MVKNIEKVYELEHFVIWNEILEQIGETGQRRFETKPESCLLVLLSCLHNRYAFLVTKRPQGMREEANN